MKIAIVFIVAMATFICFPQRYASASYDASNGKSLFQEKCSQCHTIGEGRKVGPDLYAITQARPMGYLVDVILNATHMFESGSPIAVMVLGQYRTIRMPNLNLSREQVLGILAYIRAESAKPRPAVREEPVPGNPDAGRNLFDGRVWFREGGPPCISCHNISQLPFPMGVRWDRTSRT
jgi:mono/diheme cytochrome c family protein